MTKEELIKALNDGHSIANSTWWLTKSKSTGRVYGGCGDHQCCEWDFNTPEEAVEDLYNFGTWSIG